MASSLKSSDMLGPSLFVFSVWLTKLALYKNRLLLLLLLSTNNHSDNSNASSIDDYGDGDDDLGANAATYVPVGSITRSSSIQTGSEIIASGAAYIALIGNTPMVKLSKLSMIIKRDIWIKMENLNPGGTGKDRASLYMVRELVGTHHQRAGSVDAAGAGGREGEGIEVHHNHSKVPIVEGTSGSTGIALASICNALGHPLHIVMPDDQADEKRRILETLGAIVKIVPSCSIANKGRYPYMILQHTYLSIYRYIYMLLFLFVFLYSCM